MNYVVYKCMIYFTGCTLFYCYLFTDYVSSFCTNNVKKKKGKQTKNQCKKNMMIIIIITISRSKCQVNFMFLLFVYV